MKGVMKRVVGAVIALMLAFVPVAPVMLSSGGVWADVEPDTTILPKDWDIEDILKLILNVLVYGLGVAAVVGVVIAGIMYMTARDNEAQMAKAKTRLIEIAIGLVAWGVMYAVLNWLIPGGLNLS